MSESFDNSILGEPIHQTATRRDFFKRSALVALAGGSVAACSDGKAQVLNILPHAESQHGMFGMVTAVIVG